MCTALIISCKALIKGDMRTVYTALQGKILQCEQPYSTVYTALQGPRLQRLLSPVTQCTVHTRRPIVEHKAH